MKQGAKTTALFAAILFVSTVFLCSVSFATEPAAPQLTDDIYKVAGEALIYLRTIGSIIAIIAMGLYGVGWLIANPRQKAALKEKVSGYIIGAVLLFGGMSITVWVVDILQGISDTACPVDATTTTPPAAAATPPTTP